MYKDDYKFGFSIPEDYVYKSRKGLDEGIVREISYHKSEPQWMTERRLKAFQFFSNRPMPLWGANLNTINFDDIYYYIKPTEKQVSSWEDLPPDIKKTYDTIGVPNAERDFLAGVTAQFESEVVYKSLHDELTKQGVIFLDMDSALREYPDLVKEYFGTVIPSNDNKLAALNTAVWSGGSFVYIPRGIHVDMPLQAYFRINAANAGQFERTLIIADEGSFVHYTEGCFVAGTKISTIDGRKKIEYIKVGDSVLTHTGTYQKVYNTQKRNYTGKLYDLSIWGDTNQLIRVTENHPLLVVDRERSNERNKNWTLKWKAVRDIQQGDYLTVPILQESLTQKQINFKIQKENNKGIIKTIIKKVDLSPEFARLIGFYLSEGSVSRGFYTRFSFGKHEKEYIQDVQYCLKKVFGIKKTYNAIHKKNNGISVTVSNAEVTRIFEHFGKGAHNKKLPNWALLLPLHLQQHLLTAYFNGDGNYYNKKNKHGQKEICRFSTISESLAYQIRDILLRLGVVASVNPRVRKHENGRHTMYTVGVGGAYLKRFGEIVGLSISEKLNSKNRASLFGNNKLYAFVPIKKITSKHVNSLPVFNFSVKNCESYVAGGVTVHNCTAPIYTTDSLHSAVVEIIVKPGARVRYTTVQNWSTNVYNLVTKRMRVEEEAVGEWVDCNLGSKITMKYPACYLVGRGAHGEVLSIAHAGRGQHQDAGGKMMHFASDTTSNVVSKSISQDGGRTSYRGLVMARKGATRVKSKVVCDALLLDDASRSDTYPDMKVQENNVQVEHEATVSKIGDEQLFYLTSRGVPEQEAEAMIVNGFIEPVVKELPIEYAAEMNRLIQLQMEGSIG